MCFLEYYQLGGKKLDQQFLNEFQACSKREDGLKMLWKLNFKELVEVAKHFEVYINGCKKRDISYRIVEAVVGAKLRSEAIRKTNYKMKGGNSS
ncbi:MAG: hypothetical protein ACYC2U_08255 [Candidatus Amoebophilus sp.]